MSDGLILIDASGHVVFWNPRAEEFLGWPAAEMVGRRVDEMAERTAARMAKPDAWQRDLTRALASGESETTIEIMVRPTPSVPAIDQDPSPRPRPVGVVVPNSFVPSPPPNISSPADPFSNRISSGSGT